MPNMPRRYEAIIGLLLLMPIITSNIRIKTLRTFWAMLKIKECHPIISYALIKERYVPESIVRGTSMLNALRNTAISVLWNIWADINPESRKRRMPPMMLETSIIEEEIPNTYLIFLASFLPLNMETYLKMPSLRPNAKNAANQLTTIDARENMPYMSGPNCLAIITL